MDADRTSSFFGVGSAVAESASPGPSLCEGHASVDMETFAHSIACWRPGADLLPSQGARVRRRSPVALDKSAKQKTGCLIKLYVTKNAAWQ
jgi:hypothetical protein